MADATSGYLDPFDIHDTCGPQDQAWVDLHDVARDECAAGQSSTTVRSNYRRLQQDYPNVWTPVNYWNVTALGAFVADLDDELPRHLVRLAREHPVYDEDDLGQLEDDEITAAWDQYLAADVSSMLAPDLRDQWDAADPAIVRDAFYTALSTMDYYPEHDGYDIRWHWPTVDRAIRVALHATNHPTDDQSPPPDQY